MIDSILIINKPLHFSSMDVIRRLRRKLKMKKIGHAGTLDPLATGVLIVCTGKNTKKINSFMDLPKEYVTTIDLSHVSTTHDGEGEITKVTVEKIPTTEDVLKVLKKFTGEILQVPPRYSAIKIQGKVAYKRARNGEVFNMPPRQITIHRLELISYEWPNLTIKVSCEKGTYIRTLGKDIGQELNVGGYLTKLERTAIGDYKVEQSIHLSDFLKSKIELPQNDS
jgi:tRNA pseudouridine55 synthase